MKPKVPESAVLRACLDLLAAERIWHMRVNTGAVKDGGRFFRFGRNGMSDILALPNNMHGVDGSFCPLWVECKSLTGKQSNAQELFETEVGREGHQYLLVRDVDTLRNWLQEHGVIAPQEIG